MKKLAAVTLAVLIGGISSLYAQVDPAMPYRMYLESKTGSRVDRQALERNALFHKVMQNQNKANLTFQRTFRWQEYITTTSPTTGVSVTTGTGNVSYSTKPYPTAKGETFGGYMYRDQATQKDYVLVSEEVWKSINKECVEGGALAGETFISTDGKKVSGSSREVTGFQVGDKKYKLIAFPVEEK